MSLLQDSPSSPEKFSPDGPEKFRSKLNGTQLEIVVYYQIVVYYPVFARECGRWRIFDAFR